MANSLRSLSGTYLYKYYDKTVHFSETIVKLTRDSKVLGDEELSEFITAFERRYSFSLKPKILEDYRAGRVKLLYCDKNYKLPTTVPAYLMNTGKGIVTCVNLSNNMTVNRNGLYSMDFKALFGYMQLGSILALCYQKYSYLKNKVNIIKLGSYAYSKLFTKIINKMYTLNITPGKSDTIVYLSSMFFLVNLMGRDEESLQTINKSYALANCNQANKLIIDDYVMKFDTEDFADLNKFLEAIAKYIPGMEDLDLRQFISNYISQYGPSMLLAVEYLPYFFGNLGYVLVGAYLNNQPVIENTVGANQIEELFKELKDL